MAGQPTKLNPETQRRICDAISAGNYYEAACAYGGVTYQTLLNWLSRGEAARSGIYFDFFCAVKKAEADAEVAVVAQWRKQIPENWQAARDFLARRFPRRWGPKDQHSVTADVKHSGEVKGQTDEQLRREVESMLRDAGIHLGGSADVDAGGDRPAG